VTEDPYQQPAGSGEPHPTQPYQPPAPYGPPPSSGQSYPGAPQYPNPQPYPGAPQYPIAQPYPGAPPYGGVQPPAYSPYPAPQSNGLAVAALITGIAGFFCVCAPVAIGLGIGGLSVARRTGVGRNMSIAGICLGVAWLVLIVGMILYSLAHAPSTF